MEKLTREIYENTIILNRFATYTNMLQSHLNDISSVENALNNISNENAMEQLDDFYNYIYELVDELNGIYREIEKKYNAQVD